MLQSIPATAREGHPVYFTHDEYAALSCWDVADADARGRLFVRRLEYEASYATDGPVEPQDGEAPEPAPDRSRGWGTWSP